MTPRPGLGLCAALALGLALLGPRTAAADQSEYSAALCERALVNGARRGGVPVEVLHAISLTETGRNSGGRLRPWPWAINREGKGFWFDTREEAIAFAQSSLAQGRRSFDVGCTQINYRWHGHAFPTLDAMFDPEWTATYAAQFLRTLYEERGSWSEAAGAYHSLTPELARTYRARFDRLLAGLDPAALGDAESLIATAAPPGLRSSRSDQRAAARAEMVARIRAERSAPPPPTVLGSMAAEAFQPAAGGLLTHGGSLLGPAAGPLVVAPRGGLF